MTPEERVFRTWLRGFMTQKEWIGGERMLDDAIRAAQAEQRRKDAALVCKWCRDKVPTLTLTEGSQGYSKGVLVHPEQERILGACLAQAILSQEES